VPYHSKMAVIAVVSTVATAVVGFAARLIWIDGATGVIAASVGLIGVIATALVTLTGLLLKHSIDSYTIQFQESTEKRLQVESENNRLLGKQAEDRLRVDTALRAVALIGQAKDSSGVHLQRSGALFALASLQQLDLALALLERMWPSDDVDTETAMYLLGRALNAESDRQFDAIEIMKKNIGKMVSFGESYAWPDSFSDRWKADLSLFAREGLIEIIVKVVLAVPREQWNVDYLRGIVVIVYLAMTTDPHPRIQGESAYILRELLQSDIVRRVVYFPDGRDIYFTEMQQKIAAVIGRIEVDHPIDGFRDKMLFSVKRLRAWRGATSTSTSEDEEAMADRNLTPLAIATGLATLVDTTTTEECGADS